MRKLTLHSRATVISWRLLVPIFISGILLFGWHLGLREMILPAGIVLLGYYLVLPHIIRWGLIRFARQALVLFSKGQPREVITLAKKYALFRHSDRNGVIPAKLAIAYCALKEWKNAVQCFEKSVNKARPTEQLALRIGYAKALLMVGDSERAQREGETVLNGGTRLPEVVAIVASARVSLGIIDGYTRQLLDEARTFCTDKTLCRLLDQAHADLIKPPAARKKKHSATPVARRKRKRRK